MRYFEIKIDGFRTITGMELDNFTQHILNGDDWGVFLKMVSVIEVACKRAVGLKLGLRQGASSTMQMDFNTALLICKDTKIMSKEAYLFADMLRKTRNHLLHQGEGLEFSLERISRNRQLKHYVDQVQEFVSIEGTDIVGSRRDHNNTILFGCIAILSQFSKHLLEEDWVRE